MGLLQLQENGMKSSFTLDIHDTYVSISREKV